MATCLFCGREAAEGARFCGSCGRKLFETVEEPSWTEFVEEAVTEQALEEAVFEEPAGEVSYEEPAWEEPEEEQQYYGDSNIEPARKQRETFAETMQRVSAAVSSVWGKISGACKKAFDAAAPVVRKGAASAGAVCKKGAVSAGAACKKGAASAGAAYKRASGKVSGKALKMGLIIGGASVVVVAAVVLTILTLWNNRSRDNYALYLKDGELYYTDFHMKEPMEVTSGLLGSTSGDSYVPTIIGKGIVFSADNKRMFFPDRYQSGDLSFTLYYRDVTKPRKEAEKIDSDVRYYAINAAGDKVVYIKGDGGSLYVSNLEDKERLDKDVQLFTPAEDLQKLYYTTKDNEYFVWSEGQEPEEIEPDDAAMLEETQGITTLYYWEDGDLHRKTFTEDGTEEEKVVSDVDSLLRSWNSGAYYTRTETVEHTYMDFVEDDLAASDAAMTEPEEPVYPEAPRYPKERDYPNMWDYRAAKEEYEKEYEEYSRIREELRVEYVQALDAYDAMIDRTYMREALETKIISYDKTDLYFFDGTEETLVAEDILLPANTTATLYTVDVPMMDIKAYDRSSLPHFKVSEINASAEVGDAVNAELYSNQVSYLVSGGVTLELDQEDAMQFTYMEDGSAVYYMADISEDDIGDLYMVTVTDGQPGDPERVETDVICDGGSWYWWVNEEGLFCYKDYDGENGTVSLYWNEEEVDSDVVLFGATPYIDGKLYYIADWKRSRSSGTLKVYEDGECTEIAEDVNSIAVSPTKDILYLGAYSKKRSEGDLYRYSGEKTTLIDEDVTALITVNPNMALHFCG